MFPLNVSTSKGESNRSCSAVVSGCSSDLLALLILLIFIVAAAQCRRKLR